MSPVTLEAEFRASLIAQLSQHEKVVSDAISKILRTEIPDEVKVLMFETQSDWSTIPIVAFAMDDTAPDESLLRRTVLGFPSGWWWP